MAPSNISTNRAGEQALVAELSRRGASLIEVIPGRRRTLRVVHRGRDYTLRVKARRAGTWQASTSDGEPRAVETEPTRFWVFADLAERPPALYIAPDWWVRNDIFLAHREYLARHGGHRARTDESTHHAVPLDRIAEWRDRWDQLGLD
jgi:hypothetical protein